MKMGAHVSEERGEKGCFLPPSRPGLLLLKMQRAHLHFRNPFNVLASDTEGTVAA
jgi:hypothetical protein